MTINPTHAALEWRGRTPYATRFGDVYYSLDDPVGEVRHTFLAGTEFDTLCHRDHVCVGETGFGTGLNFLEAWNYWERHAPSSARLTVISVEAYPMDRASLARAHEAFPHHAARAQALRDLWPGPVGGVHRVRLAGGRVRLILLIGDAAAMLAGQDFCADAWFLDGFAPSRNPDMWRPEVLCEIARLSRPGTALATFTAAGAVKRGLAEQGFTVDKRPGFGRKRDCLKAVRADTSPLTAPPTDTSRPWHAPPPPLPRSEKIAVVGDGIAGIAMIRALREAGRDPIHIGGDASRAYAASTLPRALIAPKLVRGDQSFPVFWRQAFHDAVREIDMLERETSARLWRGPRGLTIPADSPNAAMRNHALADALSWPDDQLHQKADGGLFVARGGTIDPQALLAALTPSSPDISCDVASIAPSGRRHALIDRDGHRICETDAVILACGPGAAPLLPGGFDIFGLRVGSGQFAMMSSNAGPTCAELQDGYVTAADADGRFAIGASAESNRDLTAIPPSIAIRNALLNHLKSRFPDISAKFEDDWTGLRCDTGDHMPVTGPVQAPETFEQLYAGLRQGKDPARLPPAEFIPGLFAATGLGARGFQAAFLLADTIASMIDGRPPALTSDIRDALAPCRFQIRAIKRNQT